MNHVDRHYPYPRLEDGPKPLTCSGLLNAPANREGTAIQAGQEYYLRVTGLTAQVSRGLEQGLLADTPQCWELDHHPFQVVKATCDPEADPWSGRTTYETLAAGRLLQGDQASRRVTLKFGSPTAFKSGGMQVPVPLPGLVFGSLVDRWNAFSPVTLSPEMRRFGEEMVAISRYRLESRPVTQKNRAVRIGGVGQVTYTAPTACTAFYSARFCRPAAASSDACHRPHGRAGQAGPGGRDSVCPVLGAGQLAGVAPSWQVACGRWQVATAESHLPPATCHLPSGPSIAVARVAGATPWARADWARSSVRSITYHSPWGFCST